MRTPTFLPDLLGLILYPNIQNTICQLIIIGMRIIHNNGMLYVEEFLSIDMMIDYFTRV